MSYGHLLRRRRRWGVWWTNWQDWGSWPGKIDSAGDIFFAELWTDDRETMSIYSTAGQKMEEKNIVKSWKGNFVKCCQMYLKVVFLSKIDIQKSGSHKKYLRVSEFHFRNQNFRQQKWNGRIKNSLEREERVVRGLLAGADSWLAEVEDLMRWRCWHFW